MEIRIGEINQLAFDSNYVSEQDKKDASLIRPVQKTEGNLARKVEKEEKDASKQPGEKGLGSEQDLEELSEELNSYLEGMSLQFEYQVNDETGDFVVKIMSKETGETIRQIPPEEVLQLREKLNELKGILFSDTA